MQCLWMPCNDGVMQCSQCGRKTKCMIGRVFAECVASKNKKPNGPGAALKSLLAKIGITAAPNCSCQRHADAMDARGCDWCEQNIDAIVGWLREEATKRGLPFLDAAGRLLVKRAIRNARRAAAS